MKIKLPHSATQLTKKICSGATIFLKFVKKILYLKKIHFFLHYFYIFLKIDNITLGSGSRLGQNSGSGSKFYVFGSIHNTEQLSSHSTTLLTETMVKLSISIMYIWKPLVAYSYTYRVHHICLLQQLYYLRVPSVVARLVFTLSLMGPFTSSQAPG